MSKTREIIKLYTDGMQQAEIARQVGCSRANVCDVVKRYAEWDRTVRGLPLAHQEWMISRAKKLRVSPKDMAARLLMEIIDMYRSGDY